VITRKKKSLGDDPLSWLKNGTVGEDKSSSKKKLVSKKKKKKVAAKRKKKITSTVNEKTGETILLESVLVIDEAMQLHKKLGSCINQKNDVIIDASGVNMIDTAMLQLLTVFVTKLKNVGLKVIWKNPSEELINRATLLDLQKQLGLC